MRTRPWPHHIRFHFSISMLVLLLVLATAGLSLLTVVAESGRTAERTAEHQFRQISERVQDRLSNLIGELDEETRILARQPSLAQPIADGPGHPSFPLLSAMLKNKPVFYSAYFAHDDGSFLQVIATRGNEHILAVHKAPAKTSLIVRTITIAPDGSKRQHWTFLADDGTVLGDAEDNDFSYDPRQRVWFGMAATRPDLALSPPYLFDSLKAPGITAAMRLDRGDGIVGVDLTLSGLQSVLDAFEVSPRGGVMLLDDQARVMAFSGKTPPDMVRPQPMADMNALRHYPFIQVRESAASGITVRQHDNEPVVVYRTRWETGGATAILLAMFAPESDFTGFIDVMRRHILLINAVLLLIVLPIVSWSAKRLARPVVELAADAERIRVWDFSGQTPTTGSIILEIDSLARAFVQMKQGLRERTHRLEQTQASLRKLVDLAIALSMEKDSARLMDMILAGAKDLARADGGTLYLRDDAERLLFRNMKNDSLGIDAGADGHFPEIPHVPLYDADGAENHRNVVSYSVHLRKPTNIADAYQVADHEFSGTRQFDQRYGYRTISLLTVPLMPRGGEPLGALQLINAAAPDGGGIVPFSTEIERFTQALSALAATAIYNRSLLDTQRDLMNSLIRILAGAIDAKSPYTGAHCGRVPELAFMLAREACDAQDGPLAAFRFETEEQWDEFRIGAWLHDCGKVTTPEYVIDKATKLETIHNRIHEIRTRFEVLLRDAEIAMLKNRLAGIDADRAERLYGQRRDALMDDFAFVASCNIGGEFMDPAKIERLRAIARIPWVRNFDDRLGLSHGELSRLAPVPVRPAPATETLLADKPEHLIPRTPGQGVFDPRLGFKMAVPEHLYNLGEIYNLSISRGTLTTEERYKINEHIVQTIIMLEGLDFPKHLKRVPEYAGTHHETLTGSGYPRQLTEKQLSIPARIMVIADIFEALTASDRPYKKPKPLSEAVDILYQFVRKRHIDPDLFHLFLKSGIYRRYAERYLSPEQNDAVDVERYLTPDTAA